MYVVSFTQAARELGIGRRALAEIVVRLNIVPKPLPGRGKGLSRDDVTLVRRALKAIDRLAMAPPLVSVAG